MLYRARNELEAYHISAIAEEAGRVVTVPGIDGTIERLRAGANQNNNDPFEPGPVLALGITTVNSVLMGV